MEAHWAQKARYSDMAAIPDEERLTYFGRTGLPWTEDEIAYLTEWYARIGSGEMAYALERSPWSVQQKAKDLGVHPGKRIVRRKQA